MRVIFMGTPTPAVPVLERLCRTPEVEVVAVVTTPDRERGRGRRSEPPPVKEAALRLGLPVWQPSGLRSQQIQDRMAELEPDVIIVAAYGRLLPAPVLELPPHGCLNLHPSLLPRHRGPSPVAAAILEGDTVAGVSLMLLNEGMDTGPVVAQREYAVTGKETAGELTGALFAMGADLLAESLGPWTRGELPAQPQGEAQATVTRKLERADGLADWTLPAGTLARQCRAYAPWPGLYTRWEGKTLKLLSVTALPNHPVGAVAPGRVIAAEGGKGIYAVTGQGILDLDLVQLEGRRAVSGEEFLRGHPEILGACLGGQ